MLKKIGVPARGSLNETECAERVDFVSNSADSGILMAISDRTKSDGLFNSGGNFTAFSDTMDGYIARRFHQITQLGKILDPAADKLTLAAVIVSLWLTRPNWWPLYTLFILKEFLMLLGGLRLHRKQVKIEGAKWFGKLSTIMFYVIMIIIVAMPQLQDRTILTMLLVLLVFMLFSLLRYGMLFCHMLKNSTKK